MMRQFKWRIIEFITGFYQLYNDTSNERIGIVSYNSWFKSHLLLNETQLLFYQEVTTDRRGRGWRYLHHGLKEAKRMFSRHSVNSQRKVAVVITSGPSHGTYHVSSFVEARKSALNLQTSGINVIAVGIEKTSNDDTSLLSLVSYPKRMNVIIPSLGVISESDAILLKRLISKGNVMFTLSL